MRLEVVLAENEEEFLNAAKKPEGLPQDYPAYYEKLLAEADDAKTEILDVQGIGNRATPSEDFQYMAAVEQPIMNYLRRHEYPHQVRILCRSQKELTAFMVVYNFWFAEDKASRLNNGKWD